MRLEHEFFASPLELDRSDHVPSQLLLPRPRRCDLEQLHAARQVDLHQVCDVDGVYEPAGGHGVQAAAGEVEVLVGGGGINTSLDVVQVGIVQVGEGVLPRMQDFHPVELRHAVNVVDLLHAVQVVVGAGEEPTQLPVRPVLLGEVFHLLQLQLEPFDGSQVGGEVRDEVQDGQAE
eukprot:768033-Hanusia_phi.AAC.7